jgi:hypothetical protein
MHGTLGSIPAWLHKISEQSKSLPTRPSLNMEQPESCYHQGRAGLSLPHCCVPGTQQVPRKAKERRVLT